MRLIIRNTIFLSIISSILAFYYVPLNNPNQQEKLLEITAKIDQELAVIKKKRRPFRVLSTELIQQISYFSNSCLLEKVIIDGVETTELYSTIRGELILTLLERRLAPSAYEKIFDMVSFQGAFLKDANLKHTNLNKIHLSRAYLVGADLSHANFEGANLFKTNLSEANLNATNFKIANLREATLKNTDLSNTILKNTYLIDAKIDNVNIEHTDFSTANISGTNIKRYDYNNSQNYAKL